MSKILIIDDEINLRETIAEMLTYLGYEIYLSNDGKDGLEKVKSVLPNLIICDIMMPVLDGYGFMEQHRVSEYHEIPVLFLSAKVEPKDKEKGIALGVKDYITKPFAFKDLKTIIDRHLKDI